MGEFFKITIDQQRTFLACLSAGVSIGKHSSYLGDVFLTLKLAKLLNCHIYPVMYGNKTFKISASAEKDVTR